ncbi:MAG: hypothetical protein U1F35_08275 [Steroidobacteraceae bacterium]
MSTLTRVNRASLLLGLCLAVIAPASQAVSVLQRGYDNLVSGSNLQETILNTSNVKTSTFGRQFDMTVDDNVFAQPLFVSGLTINGKTQDVVFIATMNDTIYAYPAAVVGKPLWTLSFSLRYNTTAVPMAQFAISGNRNIVGNLGILSTPVIDPATNLMYVVAATLEHGSMVYRLHAIDITNKREPLGPGVVISAKYGGATFDARYMWQRPSLVLAGGRVIIGFGALELEYAGGYSGWVMAYDKTKLTQVGAFATVPADQKGGGVWQSGRPPIVDGSGRVYLFTGNGYSNGYNGVNDFSETLLKLDPSQALKPIDWFTPGNWKALDSADLDLSSSGPTGIPGPGNLALVAGGGKNGILYILNANNLGKYNANDTQVVQKQQVTSGELRGGPVFWLRPASAGGSLMYVWGSDDVPGAWAFNGTKIGTRAVALGPVSPQPWPGGILTLSANGSKAGSGILWATAVTSGDAEDHPPVPGIMYAFDASNIGRQLWNSNMNPSRDSVGNFAKFVPPLVANGRVYVATQSKKVVVYGLLQ